MEVFQTDETALERIKFPIVQCVQIWKLEIYVYQEILLLHGIEW